VAAAGLAYRCDGAGNQSALLAGADDQAPRLLLGSHLDSVPNGGRFDGALGVLAALEVLQTLKAAGYAGGMGIEAVNFTDEEGTHLGCLGSRAMCGQLSPQELRNPMRGGEAFDRGLARLGLSREGILRARRNPGRMAGYLELHIEQGPRLIRAGVAIGIVTAIVGVRRCGLKFNGRADHAGTTLAGERRDAGRAACAFAVRAWELLGRDFPHGVANIGAIRFEPGAFNVVPASAVLDLEIRAPEEDMLTALEERLTGEATCIADALGVAVEIEPYEHTSATRMDTGIQTMLAARAERLGLEYRRIASGAGHDAQSFAAICPTGMIFIPSIAGRSHVPEECSHWTDCIHGANLLLQGALALSAAGRDEREGDPQGQRLDHQEKRFDLETRR
jgi:hydantoinase/carbamoylase family amidase